MWLMRIKILILFLINFDLNVSVNGIMWLVAKVLNSAVLDLKQFEVEAKVKVRKVLC